jgi:TolB protein
MGEPIAMRKVISLLLFVVTIAVPYSASAILSMELTRGVAGAVPIAIVPFAGSNDVPQNISGIVANDLQNSGRFKVYGQKALSQLPSNANDVSTAYFRHLGTDNVVIGQIEPAGSGRYQISFQLLDIFRSKGAGSVVLTRRYTVPANELRAVAHHISDLIYKQITGIRGIFSTRLAYVVVLRADNGQAHYTLELADQDGYSPRPLLSSSEPIMSPSWSPNGRQLAYVSFEHRHAGIYLQDVASGERRLLSEFPGINGAPAWSADGRRLALVLSKSGSPNIYILDVESHNLRQITHDFYINTEPAWSPDGRSLLFTSNRGGTNPQIYQVNLGSGSVSRISYDGDYNARASFTRDGKHIVMIHRVSGNYNIAILDLDTGTTRVLNSSAGDSASPSIAPNGSMILYDTVYGGRNVLGMVSSDGNVQLVLPARNGDAQDPSWSPFLA